MRARRLYASWWLFFQVNSIWRRHGIGGWYGAAFPVRQNGVTISSGQARYPNEIMDKGKRS